MPAHRIQSKGKGKQAPIVTLRRVVISLILAGALVLLGYGFSSGRDATKPPVFTDSAVEGTYPKDGDFELRQFRIGIDLASGYTAELRLDNVPIPKDQVEVVVGLDQYFYQPGPGTATGALAPGRHCASATIVKVTDPNDTGHPFAWCFQTH
ncbi:MAG: hypothetical protein QOG64_3219 [Acidimicrobiaceae bacterium]|nr:hypothetical protein [Acidimicrobiaceae bacterium]